MNRYLILAIGVISFSASCNKNPNSFGDYAQCKVDGQSYAPDNCSNCKICRIIRDSIFTFALSSNNESVAMGIHDSSGIGTKIYQLNTSNRNGGSYANAMYLVNRFLTDSIHTGTLQITLIDKIHKKIEGTFSFKAYNLLQNKIVTVTEGEIRLPYETN